ncbi:MAG: hypothetical protein MdMp014T_0351 [Treponematales bacterium]
MALRALDLFDAYNQNNLPKDKAYIVSSFINEKTGYSIYEIISYSGVKTIYPDGGGLTFQSSGKKMHILIEPPSYPYKGTEPYLRDGGEQIPLRFSELDVAAAKNQCKIMMSKKPIESLSSFTVAKPAGFNVCFIFYDLPGLYATLALFLEKTFNKDAGVPQADARKMAQKAAGIIRQTMGFKADFS